MQFLQQHQLGTARGCSADTVFRHLQVVCAIIGAGMLYQTDSQGLVLHRVFSRCGRYSVPMIQSAIG